MPHTTAVPAVKPIQDFAYISLGRGDNHAHLINVVLPARKTISNLTCEVFTDEGRVFTKTSQVIDEMVRLFTFAFPELQDGVTYRYRLLHNDEEIALGEGLTNEDLKFTYHATVDGKGEIILMSCNGLFYYTGNEKHRHRMWDLVHQTAGKRNVKHIALGGDQYYQDALEPWIPKLKGDEFKVNSQLCRYASLANALSHMAHPSYRKVMAQLTSCAIMDDHDLTDGAGGRSEYYEGLGFKEEWNNFIHIQKEMFALLQAPRNPSPIIKKDLAAFSFVQDLGETALVALDMRTEKHGGNKVLMAEDSKAALFDAIRKLTHKQVYILLPVVPLRNCVQLEGQAQQALDLADAFATAGWFKSLPDIEKVLTEVRGYRDDLNDSLTSESNKDFFMELMKVLAEGSKRGVKYAFLSGDIHTGGTVEIFATVDGHQFRIPMIISSPIGYDPMNAIAEAALREKKIITIEHAGVKLEALTGRFSTDRNFVCVEINRLFSHPNTSVLIYEERINGPRRLLVEDWVRENEEVVDKPAPLRTPGAEA